MPDRLPGNSISIKSFLYFAFRIGDPRAENIRVVLGKGYVLRAEAQGVAGKVAQAAGVALPPTLRPCPSVA